MVSHEYPIIPSPNQPQQSPQPDEPRDDEFPRPDKDEQHLKIERMLGYAPKKKRTGLKIVTIAVIVVVVGLGVWFAALHIHLHTTKVPPKT